MAKYVFRTTRQIEVVIEAPEDIDTDDIEFEAELFTAMEEVTLDGELEDGSEWTVDSVVITETTGGGWEDVTNEGL